MNSTRRDFLRTLGMAAATVAGGCRLTAKPGVAPAADKPRLRKPNILVFFTDDQRASTIHALGNPDIHTPNLDKLVAAGTTFTRAYMMGGMTGATCVPSRAMLHTGQHLFHLKNNGREMPDGTLTLAETMRAGGYHTYFTGKRHALPRKSLQRGFVSGGVVMGFAGYFTDKRRMPPHDWDPKAIYDAKGRYIVIGDPGEKRLFGRIPGSNKTGAKTLPPGPFSTQLYVDPAVRFLKTYKDRAPWFMYVSLSAPHDPHEAPEEIRRMYDPKKLSMPPNCLPEHPFDNGDMNVRDEKLIKRPRDPALVRQRTADYYAAITMIDRQFGRLMTVLKETGQLDNTIVVFMGDSGLAIGQHGLLGKQNLYDDAGVHVPWIMAGPRVGKNQKCDALVCTFDLYPTLCGLAWIPT